MYFKQTLKFNAKAGYLGSLLRSGGYGPDGTIYWGGPPALRAQLQPSPIPAQS